MKTGAPLLARLASAAIGALLDGTVALSFGRPGFRVRRWGFDPADLDVDLSGRTALVTGTNSGSGARLRPGGRGSARAFGSSAGARRARRPRRARSARPTAARACGPRPLTSRASTPSAPSRPRSTRRRSTSSSTTRARSSTSAPRAPRASSSPSRRTFVTRGAGSRSTPCTRAGPTRRASAKPFLESRAITRPILRSAEEGADTIVWLAASPRASAASETGCRFWLDRRPRRTHILPWTRDDPRERERLWALLSRLAGIEPPGLAAPGSAES